MAIQLPYTGVTTSETVPSPYVGTEKTQLPYTALVQTPFSSGGNLSVKEDKSNKGIANGYAPLNGTSKVPYANLPITDVAKNIDEKIAGVVASDATKFLFSTYNPNNGVNPVVTRSTTCWAKNIDTSPISVWTDGNGTGVSGPANAMTLISPRHVIVASHWANNFGGSWSSYIGAKVMFVGMNNTCHVRTWVNSTPVAYTEPNGASSDNVVALLDTDLPPSVSFCELLTPELAREQFPDGTSASRKPVFFQTYYAGTDGHKALIAEHMGPPSHYNANGVIYPPLNTTRLPFYEQPEVGDSGRPVAFVVSNKLVLCFTFSGATAGLNVSEFNSEIYTAMALLGGNSSNISAHTHGNITNTGAIGSTANLPLITTTSGVVTTGAFGTTANSFCQGNDPRISGIQAIPFAIALG